MSNIKIGLTLGSGGASKPNGNPSALTLTVLSDTSIKCDWTNGATNQNGTYIYISTDNITFTNNATALGSLATKTLIGLTENTIYYIKVVHYKGTKLSEYSNIANAITYTEQLTAILARMDVAPEDDPITGVNNKVVYNETYKSLRTESLLTPMDALWVFSAHSESVAFLNLIKNAHNIEKVGTAHTFKKNIYLEPPGTTTGFYDLNYNPRSQAVNFAKDSATLCEFILDKGTKDRGISVGANDGTNALAQIALNSSNKIFVSANQSTSSNYTITTNGGIYSFTRFNANLFKGFYNNVEKFSVTNQTSSDTPDLELAIGGQRSAASTVADPADSQYLALSLSSQLNKTQINTLGGIISKHIIKISNRIGVIGDSTVAAYLGGTAIAALFNANGKYTMVDVSDPGDTITQQNTAYAALTAGSKIYMRYMVVQIGLNDLNPAESAATALGRYQTLITDIIASKNIHTKILLATMTPCKQRLIDVYGAVNGLVSYQKWLDMNDAIRGIGANAITGADGFVDTHTTALNDGNGNLKAEYEAASDHIHENDLARQIIADAWYSKMQQLG